MMPIQAIQSVTIITEQLIEFCVEAHGATTITITSCALPSASRTTRRIPAMPTDFAAPADHNAGILITDL